MTSAFDLGRHTEPAPPASADSKISPSPSSPFEDWPRQVNDFKDSARTNAFVLGTNQMCETGVVPRLKDLYGVANPGGAVQFIVRGSIVLHLAKLSALMLQGR